MQIALFVTCLGEQFHPRALAAAVGVLEHLGHEVAFPSAQTCCGQPMFNNGFRREAKGLAERMGKVFAPFEAVVTPSGSCAAMVREHYPALWEGESLPEAVRELVDKTSEFAEFLVASGVDLAALERSASAGGQAGGAVTWHTSCHLRGIHGMDHTENLLGQFSGVALRRTEKVHQCCGFGGTFACAYPTVSGTMVQDKVACLAATQAPTWVSSDTGCTMNIAGRCRRDGVKARIVHLAEFVAERLGLMAVEETGW